MTARSQLGALLGAYLRMSLRGKTSSTFFARRASMGQGTLTLVAIYAIMGSVASFAASGSRNAFSYALVMHTITFVMLGMTLAVESGDLLFHAAEHDVLGHLPLSGRTLLVAKAVSLMAFALLLALAINLPAVVIGSRLGWVGRWFPAAHLAAVVLLAALSCATVVFTYGLVVRFVGRDRFDRVAAWSQAGLSATFLALSQGLAHLVELPIVRLDANFCVAFPPAWFAALDVLGGGAWSPRALALGLLAVTSTVALAWAALTRLAAGYADAFSTLGEAHRPLALATPIGRGAGWWITDPVERAAFRLAVTYVRRDREIMTRLYPSLGFFVLLPVAQLLSHAAYRFKAAALLSVLLLGMLPSMVLEALRVSSQHIAAEVFAVAPLASAGPLFQGVRKAAVCYILLPAAGVAALWIVLTDVRVLPLAIPSLLALPALSLLPAAFRQYVPLSVPPAVGRQSLANIVVGMITTIVGATTVGVSWLAWRTGYLGHLIVAGTMLLALGSRLLARRIENRPLRGGV
jgi:ABC-2 type transport system permease protein